MILYNILFLVTIIIKIIMMQRIRMNDRLDCLDVKIGLMSKNRLIYRFSRNGLLLKFNLLLKLTLQLIISI